MEHLIALLPLLSSQPFLQAVVGVVGLVLCTFMVVRANKDKQALPPPAAGSITDVPQPFMQGPREVIDIIREQRDLDRRRTEDTGRCQTALNIDPGSASNFDPVDGYGGTPLISPAKRVGVAQPG